MAAEPSQFSLRQLTGVIVACGLVGRARPHVLLFRALDDFVHDLVEQLLHLRRADERRRAPPAHAQIQAVEKAVRAVVRAARMMRGWRSSSRVSLSQRTLIKKFQ